jgi:hypothetical protein
MLRPRSRARVMRICTGRRVEPRAARRRENEKAMGPTQRRRRRRRRVGVCARARILGRRIRALFE